VGGAYVRVFVVRCPACERVGTYSLGYSK
jgi:hypothetical protein